MIIPAPGNEIKQRRSRGNGIVIAKYLPVLSTPIPVWIPILLLAAALLSSLVSRILLVGKAFNISTRWGLIVLFAPFGPGFFRLTHEDIAQPTRYWRMAVGPLMLLFFVTGGSLDSVQSLMDLGKPSASSGNVISSLFGQKPVAPAVQATPAPAAVAAQATPDPKATPAIAKTAPADKAKATPAVAAAPALTIQDLTDRIAANQRELERLSEWYEQLKHERGYLRKHDDDGIAAYNDEAAKYQAAVQAAKNEQAAIAKLSAKK